jgi:predicted dehydrogenase
VGARGAANAEIVAVGSRDGARARAYAGEHGIPRAHDSYEALLADPEVDAIYNPLPNSLHVEWSMRALEAGKHVLCEKPLTRHPADVDRAFDAADRAGRRLMEAFMWRFHPQTEQLVAMVRDGAIGRLRLVRAAFGFDLPDAANVRWLAELEGGALMDVGCYCVNGARLLAGEPQSVTAQQIRGGDGVDIGFVATLSFDNDVLAHFDAGMSFASRDALEVVGDQASIFLDDPWRCVNPIIELHRAGDRPEKLEIERVNPYRLEAENLSAAIEGRRPPLLGREDAVGQARCIEALYEAAAQSRAVALA